MMPRMTTKLSMITASATVLALGALFAGCGSSSKSASTSTPATSSTPATTTSATTATAATTTAATTTATTADSGDPVTVKGKTGDTLTLAGSGLHDNPDDHTKTKVKVTLKGTNGPFPHYDVAAGHELIGVKLHFVNVGPILYDDPQPDGQLVLADGETGKQTNLIQLSGSDPCDDPSLKLKTGQSKDVCIAFDVPKRQVRKTFQYVTDAGYGDTGLWQLH